MAKYKTPTYSKLLLKAINTLDIFNKVFRYYTGNGGIINNTIFQEAIKTGNIQIFTPVFEVYKFTRYSMTQNIVDASIISKNADIIAMTRSLIPKKYQIHRLNLLMYLLI